MKKVAKAASLQADAVAELDPITRRAMGIRRGAVKASLDSTKDKEVPYVALKYFDASFECFSDWQADELKLFTEFLGKLRSTSWNDIQVSGGFRCKQIDTETVQEGKSHLNRVLAQVSKDISLIELRINRGIRVHGFRATDAFFLILLDREHRLYPE